MKKFFKANWVELLAGLGVVVGLVFVLQNPQARQAQLSSMAVFFQELARKLGAFGRQTMDAIQNLSTFETAAILLIILCAVLIGVRVRYRVLRSERWISPTCPKCGSDLARIRRTSFDRFLSASFLPDARRYQCRNQACDWQGLKHIQRTGHHRRRLDESDSAD